MKYSSVIYADRVYKEQIKFKFKFKKWAGMIDSLTTRYQNTLILDFSKENSLFRIGLKLSATVVFYIQTLDIIDEKLHINHPIIN